MKITRETGLFVLIGGTLGLLIIILYCIWILVRRKDKLIKPVNQESISRNDMPGLRLPIPKETVNLVVPVEDVYCATNNLHESNFIGQGTAGKVYKGIFPSKQHVAIKHIPKDGCSETFCREVRSMSHVRHPNLVSLLGYSENEGQCFVIYELCHNGSLSDWLYGKDKVLSWIQRLEIAIGSAQGLLYLHTYPRGCIVHRDIKPTNILLGSNFEAKLSDFGLSKVMNNGESFVISEVRGTFGYVDPEYRQNGRVSASGDVYSFGIVLLQVLSGRKVINMNMMKPMPLNKIAKSLTRTGCMAEFADPELHGDYSVEAFKLTFELALLCIAPKQQRPSIAGVILKLEEALSRSKRITTPTMTPDWSLAL